MEEELKLKQQKIEEQAKEIAELRNFRDSVIRSFTP
jgi:hypothetical protein